MQKSLKLCICFFSDLDVLQVNSSSSSSTPCLLDPPQGVGMSMDHLTDKPANENSQHRKHSSIKFNPCSSATLPHNSSSRKNFCFNSSSSTTSFSYGKPTNISPTGRLEEDLPYDPNLESDRYRKYTPCTNSSLDDSQIHAKDFQPRRHNSFYGGCSNHQPCGMYSNKSKNLDK